jgi:hypothetical protein
LLPLVALAAVGCSSAPREPGAETSCYAIIESLDPTAKQLRATLSSLGAYVARDTRQGVRNLKVGASELAREAGRDTRNAVRFLGDLPGAVALDVKKSTRDLAAELKRFGREAMTFDCVRFRGP